MAHIVIMPKQGLQMTEGTMIKWYYAEGETVKAGTPLFSMETDKLTIDIDAEEGGTLLKILHGEGDVVPITEPIAVIGEKNEALPAGFAGKGDAVQAAPAAQAEPAAQAAPAALPEGVTPVIMPKQGLQMTEGTIIKWYVREGGAAEEGKPLFSMETDKLTIDIDAPASGTVLKILAEEGSVVPITETIAYLGKPGPVIPDGNAPAKAEAAPAAAAAGAAPAETVASPAFVRKPGQRLFISPRARMKAKEAGADPALIPGSGPDGMVIERDVLAYLASRPKTTPVAAVIAAQNGVDLNGVKGTGVNGKIMKEDVLNAMKPAEAPAAPAASAAAENVPEEKKDETVIPIRGMRKAIFNNMMNSLHGMAQANHRMKVDMTECRRLREALKAAGQKVSFNDILILAVTKALLKHPCVNASTDGTNIYEKHYTNVGLAVAVENGLMVPNIKHTEKMTLPEIASASAALVAKTREGRLTMDDYTGGTFTVTNLGMFDVDEFTPVINAPEAAILGVGKIGDTPVALNGQVVIRPIMTLSLTYDHRIINGAPAAEFLQDLKKLLEQPYLML